MSDNFKRSIVSISSCRIAERGLFSKEFIYNTIKINNQYLHAVYIKSNNKRKKMMTLKKMK